MATTLARANQMDAGDKEKILADVRKQQLKHQASIEIRNSKYNMSKIQESWLKIMRSASAHLVTGCSMESIGLGLAGLAS